MAATKIEWCDESLNPIVGCSHVSPGCTNCYAERMAIRQVWMDTRRYDSVITQRDFAHVGHKSTMRWNGKTAWVDGVVERALHMRKPCRIFWGSMTDLFHEATPPEWVDRIVAAAALTPQHTHIFLTKRPERMREYFVSRSKSVAFWESAARSFGHTLQFQGISCVPFPLPNLLLGVTAEDQQRADERIPILLQIPAAVRFVSIEPCIGPVNLRNCKTFNGHIDALKGIQIDCTDNLGIPTGWRCPPLDWVILGGESGPGARPMHPDWARGVRDQCQAAGVPLFFKGWGGVRRDAANRFMKGRAWNELPEGHS